MRQSTCHRCFFKLAIIFSDGRGCAELCWKSFAGCVCELDAKRDPPRPLQLTRNYRMATLNTAGQDARQSGASSQFVADTQGTTSQSASGCIVTSAASSTRPEGERPQRKMFLATGSRSLVFPLLLVQGMVRCALIFLNSGVFALQSSVTVPCVMFPERSSIFAKVECTGISVFLHEAV